MSVATFHQRTENENERYAPHAFDSCIGQDVPLKILGQDRGRATVISVVVDEDGRGATWTVEAEDPHPERTQGISEAAAGQMSFGFRVPEKPGWFR